MSFHSKYSKNVYETASAHNSVKVSQLSKKQKGQLSKEFKKVSFFFLKGDKSSKMDSMQDDDESDVDDQE